MDETPSRLSLDGVFLFPFLAGSPDLLHFVYLSSY